jgi:hypothetical protein
MSKLYVFMFVSFHFRCIYKTAFGSVFILRVISGYFKSELQQWRLFVYGWL